MSGIAELYPIQTIHLEKLEKLVAELREGVDASLAPKFKSDVIIRRFTICFECAWTALRSQLHSMSIGVYNPLEAIGEASKQGWLGAHTSIWLEMLSFKTRVAFLQDDKSIYKACTKISDIYILEMESLVAKLKELG